MSISFACPYCETIYTVPADVAGQSTTCRKCQEKIAVPIPLARAAEQPSFWRKDLSSTIQTLCQMFIAGVVALWLVGTCEQEKQRQEAVKRLDNILRPPPPFK